MFHALAHPPRPAPGPDWTRILGTGFQLTTDGGPDAAPCCICMDDLCQDQLALALPCGHVYHSDCIHKWLKCKAWCPQCREAVA